MINQFRSNFRLNKIWKMANIHFKTTIKIQIPSQMSIPMMSGYVVLFFSCDMGTP